MVWGIMPVESDVSWESHLMGAAVGLIYAFVFRKQIPPEKKYEWEEEEENIDDMTDEEINELIESKIKAKYIFKKARKAKE